MSFLKTWNLSLQGLKDPETGGLEFGISLCVGCDCSLSEVYNCRQCCNVLAGPQDDCVNVITPRLTTLWLCRDKLKSRPPLQLS